jgi:hypothetical protein
MTGPQLVDMEWKFGVTASSDDEMQVGASFLQMKLVIDRGSGKVQSMNKQAKPALTRTRQYEHCFMEVSLEQFYNFMAQMEKAKAYVDYMTADT